ncbi:BTA121 domain-containing protein surface lipoprotein [Borrelia crocidurae]|uniref:Lipoprotein n=1 Tax=Borrelia crocidurae (strain Achema) TaxID=1155096 RepID=I0FED5_BORCA|nr:hypothetical protein [Borrelia crocidurae]AFI31841.1 hypothetical protein Q7M_1133 [Borrelia crocidurae str. Achema]
MVKGKGCILLLFLILIIGCNFKSIKKGEMYKQGLSKKISFEDRIGLVNFVFDDLNEFKISSENQEFVMCLERVVGDPDIMVSKTDRTYTKDEFYHLLKNMNRDDIDKIMEFNVIYKDLKKVEKMIFDFKWYKLRDNLNFDFQNYKNIYFLSLKRIFGMFSAGKNIIHPNDTVEHHSLILNKFVKDIENIRIFDSCFVDLFDNEQRVIYYMCNVMSNMSLAFDKPVSHCGYEFYSMLGNFGSNGIKNIIKIHLDIIDKIFEIEKLYSDYLYDNIMDQKETFAFRNAKYSLRRTFSTIKTAYDLSLRIIFKNKDINAIYNSLVNFNIVAFSHLDQLKADIFVFIDNFKLQFDVK